MSLDRTLYPDATDFHQLSDAEKSDIVCAVLRACGESWGEECMPAADIGDTRLFVMSQLCEWVSNCVTGPM